MKTYEYDFPKEFLDKHTNSIRYISIDIECTGLSLFRDRLCSVQIMINDNDFVIIHFPKQNFTQSNNLSALLTNDNILKYFHYARFDVAFIKKFLNITVNNFTCTKILSKIGRTYTEKHGLAELVRVVCDKNINKGSQTSYWGDTVLQPSQKDYMCNDVRFLPQIAKYLLDIVNKENKTELIKVSHDLLNIVIKYDLLGVNMLYYVGLNTNIGYL